MPRKREKKKEAIVVSKPLPAYPLLSAVRFWRRGWLAREKLMAERGGGERKTTTYRRLIGRGVSPIPLDFRTRQKSCLYEEKHFWQPVAISARKRPDIVNGPSSNRRRKRERERYRVQNFPRFTRVHYYFRRMITPIPPIRTKSRTRNSLINYNYNRSIILMF